MAHVAVTTTLPVLACLGLEKSRRSKCQTNLTAPLTTFKRELQPPSVLLKLYTTKRHRKNEGRPSSQNAHDVQTVTKFGRTRQANSTQKGSSLTCLLPLFFSHHIPLLSLSQPVHGESKAFLAVTMSLLAAAARRPGLMHFLAPHVQGHATTQCHLCQLAVLQEKGDLVTRPIQPDDIATHR